MRQAARSIFALTPLLLAVAGCAGPRARPAHADADGEMLQEVAATRPATTVAAPVAEPQPSRPYYPRADLVPGYVVDPNWPIHKPPVAWGGMAGAAVDRMGNVWTLNRSAVPVQVYSPEGRLLQMWPNSVVKGGHQIRIDGEGFVWVADYRQHVVRKFDRSGAALLTLGTPGVSGTDETHLNLPCDVAVSPDGEAFVADGYGNNRVVHFDKEGRFVKSWGTLGVKEGDFSIPHSIAMDSKGLLYVADRNNNRVQVFDRSGKFVRAWAGMMVPWTLHVTADDELYVVGCSPSRWEPNGQMVAIPPKDQIVMRLKLPDFRVISWWSFPFQPKNDLLKPGDLNWVHALAVDREGNLFLGDVQGNRIQKFWAVPATTTVPTTAGTGKP